MSDNEIDSSTNEIAELVDALKEQAVAKNKTTLLKPPENENGTKSNDEFDLEEAVTALIPGQRPNDRKSQAENTNFISQLRSSLSDEKTRQKAAFYSKLFLALLVLLVIIYFIFFYKPEDTFVINLPIPYVYDQPYLQSLETFAHLDCHNEVLIISGPRGIGKSRGISTFIDNNINVEGHSNRLVINFDCDRLTKYSTDDDIVDFFRNSIIEGIRSLDNYVSSVYRLSPFTTDRYYITEQVSAISRAFRKNVGYSRHRFNRPIRDPFLRSIAKDISIIISQLKEEPSFCINLIVQCLQILSPSLRPFIVINSPEKLYYLGQHHSTESFNSNLQNTTEINATKVEDDKLLKGSSFATEVFDSVVKSFKRISHDTVRYGIIIEVSDMVWLSSMAIKYRSDIGIMNVIRNVAVGEFDVNDAKRQMTLRGMFKPQQVQSLYEDFGGYGPHFAQVHELMQKGHQFQEAVSLTKRSVFNNFVREIYNLGLLYPSSGLKNDTQGSNFSTFDPNSLMNDQEKKECYDFLNRMIKDHEISFKKEEEVSSNLKRFIISMVKDGVFYLKKNKHLKFTNLAEMKSAQIFMQKINQYYQ